MKDDTIYYLDDETISNQALIEEYIYPNKELNYYWSDDFSPQFYQKLATAGFITTTMYDMQDKLVLLPEIQFDYAVLDFSNLHISKKVKKLLKTKTYEFRLNHNLKAVLDAIENYHETSWVVEEYKTILINLSQQNSDQFQIMSIELYDTKTNRLIAGEVGYKIGATYTSLTGFFTKEKTYNNWGKLQLVLLGQYLEKNHYDFWNLGHASLQYKIDLGAHVLNREQFLQRWKESIKK